MVKINLKLIAYLPGLKRIIAFRHAYSVWSISTFLNRMTVLCNSLISAILPRSLSDPVYCSVLIPDAARRELVSIGRFHWATLRTNNSLQLSSSRIAWSLNGRSRNVGIFRTHFTVIYSTRMADSYTTSGKGMYRTGYVPGAVPCWGVWGGVMLLGNTDNVSLVPSLVPLKPLKNPFLCSRGYRLLYKSPSGGAGELWYFSFPVLTILVVPSFSVSSVSYVSHSSCFRLRGLATARVSVFVVGLYWLTRGERSCWTAADRERENLKQIVHL